MIKIIFRVLLWPVLLAAKEGEAAFTVNPWTPIFRGVDFTTGEADTNEVRQQKVFALRVDLSEPTVEFFSTPSNGSGPLETFGQTTTAFVQTYGAAAGVNANFFSPVNITPNDPRDLSGLAISQGTVVSAFENGRPAALISRSNQVSFATSAPANYNNVWTAVSGSDRVLVNGVAQLEGCVTSFCGPNPRTALGLSQNQRYFYMVVIDGRQTGWSDGATLFETGGWLLRLGAWNGLNLDGGGSTAMSKIESGSAILLNQPSGGIQRVNGNHLGIFAQVLPPLVLTQPQNQNVLAGQSVTFSVFAGGTTPLRYQWRFNGTNLPGATLTSLMLASVQPANTGFYSVFITNSAGQITSSNAALTVTIPFEITGLSVQPRPHSALISWTSSPASLARIEYGAPDLATTSAWENSLRSSHRILLVGLAAETNYVFRIHSQFDTNQVVSSQFNFSTDVSVVVDNPQVSYAGNWTLGTSSPDQYGGYFQYATTVAEPAATAYATYTPNLVTPGNYDVYAWYPAGPNRSGSAQLSVLANGGYATRSLDQRTGGGSWQLMFPFLDFAAGTAGSATIGNNTGETDKIVAADAIRWVYARYQDIPTDGSVPDWWSGHYFGTNIDGSLDHDHDGYSTYSEYVVGTDPLDPASRFHTALVKASNDLSLTCSPCLAGRAYELQTSTNLASGWSEGVTSPIINNPQGVFALTNAASTGPRFYRVAVHLVP